MSFFKFNPEDILTTFIYTYPHQVAYITNGLITGSISLEKQTLVDSTWRGNPYAGETLKQKRYQGYSEKLGGFTERRGPFSASIRTYIAISRRYQ